MSLSAFFAKSLKTTEPFVQELLQSARDGHLCLERSEILDLPPPIIRNQNLYYLQRNWVYETHIVEQIRRLQGLPRYTSPSFQEPSLLPEQQAAVQHAFENHLSFICGGPGTGKTYTAGFLVRLLAASTKGLRVILTAPTGKAALHLQSSLLARGPLSDNIVCEAVTLHRLLYLQPGETKLFSQRKIDADLVIVDEASMIDVSLFAHLLGAIGNETRLVLMGDPNQLPPIEAGSLFAECADLFGLFLTKGMRMESNVLADAILRGDAEEIPLTETFDEEKIPFLISTDKLDPEKCLQQQTNFCVLNALRQGPSGADAWNEKILRRMDHECKPGQWWAVPILATANLPHRNLSNGARGVIIGQKGRNIDLASGKAYFAKTGFCDFLPPFELGFVLSIHKSQGSEFDEVVVLLPEGSENFGKEALYTAVTRAKKRCTIIGKKEIIEQMLAKNSRKRSGLKARLCC